MREKERERGRETLRKGEREREQATYLLRRFTPPPDAYQDFNLS